MEGWTDRHEGKCMLLRNFSWSIKIKCHKIKSFGTTRKVLPRGINVKYKSFTSILSKVMVNINVFADKQTKNYMPKNLQLWEHKQMHEE